MYCDWPSLGRCCFCMPLRQGILAFGYVNLFLSAFLVGVYSYSVHTDFGLWSMYHGAAVSIPEELCIVIYCIELIFSVVLIYGAHMKLMVYIKIYYYFTISTTVAVVLIQIIELATLSNRMGAYMIFELGPLLFAALCIQVYLIILIRSLLKKMEISGPNIYDNPLQQVVFDGKTDNNGIYDTTVVPVTV